MDPTPFRSAPPEGLPFDLRDLRAAMSWAADRPGVLLSVTTDHPQVPEAIEIYPPGSSSPRWCIWRDYEGHLRVDDWAGYKFDLPYPTLLKALGFISSSL